MFAKLFKLGYLNLMAATVSLSVCIILDSAIPLWVWLLNFFACFLNVFIFLVHVKKWSTP